MDWVASHQELLPELLVAMRSTRRNHVVFRWRARAHSQYPSSCGSRSPRTVRS